MLAKLLLDQRHVRLQVVVHVELGVVFIGVKDCCVERHCCGGGAAFGWLLLGELALLTILVCPCTGYV